MLIRVPMFSGHYTFEFITPDKTGVIYQCNVDLAGHMPLYDLVTTQNGMVSQKLLYAWGSDAARKEAVKILLAAYLESRTSDPAIVEKILSDDRLIHAIQTGSAVDNRPATAVLEAYLKG